MQPDSAALVAAILNAAYMVRHYRRRLARAQQDQAFHALGLAVRDAFNRSEDFRPLLQAIRDGLSERDDDRAF